MILSKKLGNENFVKNAPEEVVESDKQNLLNLESTLDSLESSLSRLQ